MKKLIPFFLLMWSTFLVYPQYQPIENGDGGGVARNKINNQFEQIYSFASAIQFSADGASNWHVLYVDGDKYVRYSDDLGTTWSAACEIANYYTDIVLESGDDRYIKVDIATAGSGGNDLLIEAGSDDDGMGGGDLWLKGGGGYERGNILLGDTTYDSDESVIFLLNLVDANGNKITNAEKGIDSTDVATLLNILEALDTVGGNQDLQATTDLGSRTTNDMVVYSEFDSTTMTSSGFNTIGFIFDDGVPTVMCGSGYMHDTLMMIEASFATNAMKAIMITPYGLDVDAQGAAVDEFEIKTEKLNVWGKVSGENATETNEFVPLGQSDGRYLKSGQTSLRLVEWAQIGSNALVVTANNEGLQLRTDGSPSIFSIASPRRIEFETEEALFNAYRTTIGGQYDNDFLHVKTDSSRFDNTLFANTIKSNLLVSTNYQFGKRPATFIDSTINNFMYVDPNNNMSNTTIVSLYCSMIKNPDIDLGDMSKSIYDVDDNGVVDNSEQLSGQNASYYLDNTDTQDLSLSGNTLSLTGDGTSVNLSGYLDNTDVQFFDVAQLSGSDLQLSISGDGQATKTIDLSSLGASTYTLPVATPTVLGGSKLGASLEIGDEGANILNLKDGDKGDITVTNDGKTFSIDNLAVSGGNLENYIIKNLSEVTTLVGDNEMMISLFGTTTPKRKTKLSSIQNFILNGQSPSYYLDNTDAQIFDVAELSGSNLLLSISGDGQATKSIDLSSLGGSTYTLPVATSTVLGGSKLGASLEIGDEGANILNLKDGDKGDITVTNDGKTFSIDNLAVAGGNLENYIIKNLTEVTSLVGEDEMMISLFGTTTPKRKTKLSSIQNFILNGQSPSYYLDNTDAQTFDVAELSGSNLLLSISGDGQATESIDLSGLSGSGNWLTDDSDLYTLNNVAIGTSDLDAVRLKVYQSTSAAAMDVKNTSSTGNGIRSEITQTGNSSTAISGISTAGVGVLGNSQDYFGVWGTSTNGYGGYFAGKGVLALQYHLYDLNSPPSSAIATGTKGEIRVTEDYIYVCTATNTWKRTALSTW